MHEKDWIFWSSSQEYVISISPMRRMRGVSLIARTNRLKELGQRFNNMTSYLHIHPWPCDQVRNGPNLVPYMAPLSISIVLGKCVCVWSLFLSRLFLEWIPISVHWIVYLSIVAKDPWRLTSIILSTNREFFFFVYSGYMKKTDHGIPRFPCKTFT